MNRLEQIQERMAAIKSEIEERGDALTADEIKAFTDEVDTLETEKRSLVESQEQRSGLLERIASGETTGAVVHKRSFTAVTGMSVASGDNEVDPDDPYSTTQYRRAFQKFVTTGQSFPPELRANQITKTGDASVLIPSTVLNRILEKLGTVGNIISLVTRTSIKGGVQIPKSSVKPTATWVAEGKGSDTQKKTVEYIEFTWNKLRCAVAITLEMETMALPIFEQTIVANIIEAMKIALETAIISGSGSGQPKGILTETITNDRIVTLTGNTVTLADLAAAEAALPAEYDNKAEWCMSKAALVQVMTIVDKNKQPIFRNIADSNGKLIPTIWGRKVNLTSYVPALSVDTAPGTCVAFMFDFKDYILNMNKQITMKKYTDETTDDEIMKAVALADGECADVGSLVKVMTAGTSG